MRMPQWREFSKMLPTLVKFGKHLANLGGLDLGGIEADSWKFVLQHVQDLQCLRTSPLLQCQNVTQNSANMW